jgi:guanine deaminase
VASTPGTTRTIDDRRFFQLETLYDEFSKPWQERRLPMVHEPNEQGAEVYERWQELNS